MSAEGGVQTPVQPLEVEDEVHASGSSLSLALSITPFTLTYLLLNACSSMSGQFAASDTMEVGVGITIKYFLVRVNLLKISQILRFVVCFQ